MKRAIVLLCLALAASADDLQRANELAWAKRFAEAEAMYRALPPSPASTLGLARVVMWQGRYAEAIALFETLAGVDALEGKAQAQYWSGDWRAAAGNFRRVLEMDPGREESRRSLGEILATARPSQRVTVAGTTDDQPLELIRTEVAATVFSDPQTRWTGSLGRYDGDASGEFASVANETTIRGLVVNGAEVRFTHVGLVPQYECYDVCSNAWSGYLGGSLRNLINTGKGQPNPKEGGDAPAHQHAADVARNHRYAFYMKTRQWDKLALLEKERWELETMPDEELAELAGLYEKKGLSADLARQVAVQLHENDALAAHAEIELGIDPNEFTNPWHAAVSSAASFAVGAALPLLAITLTPPDIRVYLTFVVVILALIGTGLISAHVGGAPKGRAVLRNVVVGVVTMAVTFAIGAGLVAAAREAFDALIAEHADLERQLSDPALHADAAFVTRLRERDGATRADLLRIER